MEFKPLFSPFYLVDTTKTPLTGDILFPFAFDEVLCRKVGLGECPPILHIWRHQKAFVMGLRDRKLPFALKAMDWLMEQGYKATVRNSGGAAVPLDPGVINMTLILPNPTRNLAFRRDFELMAQLIQGGLAPFTSEVEAGEITGSYCPGDFDLSVQGQKFCGIAQRRQTKAYAVQAFIVVEGKGQEKGAIAQEFYRIASGESGELDYPRVQPIKMASLTELIGELSTDSFVKAITDFVRPLGILEEFHDYRSFDLVEIEQTIRDLRNRYENRN
jgi:octanoyl-[GcvH]:protein N-octanoyltransferase